MIKRITEQYASSAFARNVMVMFTGNGLSLVLPLLLAPLITRLYTPEDFAGYELYARIISLVGVLAVMRYEYAIIIPAEDAEAEGIVKLGLRIVVAVTLISAVIFIPLRQNIAVWLSNEDLVMLCWWVPPGVFFTGVLLVFTQYLTRTGGFKTLSANKVIATTGNHLSKYLLGFKYASAAGLVWGHLIGLFMPVVFLLGEKRVRQVLSRIGSNPYSSRALAKKYKEFPLVNSSHAFFDEGQKALLLFIISAQYGEYIIGLFAFVFRYLRIPVQVFGSALGQVVMPRLASDLNAGIGIKPKISRIMFMLALIGVLPFGVLMLFGETIFGIVFSSEWSEAGRYAAVMAPWLFFNFMVSPISLLPTVVNRQRTFFTISFSFVTMMLLGVMLMISSGKNFYDVLIWISAMGMAMDAFQAWWFLRIAGQGRPQSAN